VAAIASAVGVPANATTQIKAVSGLQQTNTITKSFLVNFMKVLNERGKGVVNVKYLGGHSVVPPRKAAKALKRGQFDMLDSPVSYYIGMVPEGYALLASNMKPSAIRANGGWDILQEVFAKKAGSRLIAWGEYATQYNMYLMNKPKFDKDGVPDLTGIKMRATGTYRPLFKALGASTINMKSSEIYTGIQRGVVQGFGWPNVAIVPLGLHKIVKYRISPAFYQTNTVVTMNLDFYNKLSGKAKNLINSVAADYEKSAVVYMEAQRAAEEKILLGAGVKDIKLTGSAAAKYLSIAHSEIWKQLKDRSEYSARLRAKLYQP
jgi:TRAP-type C4-dicarboxylate transport system substrate-binding protein